MDPTTFAVLGVPLVVAGLVVATVCIRCGRILYPARRRPPPWLPPRTYPFPRTYWYGSVPGGGSLVVGVTTPARSTPSRPLSLHRRCRVRRYVLVKHPDDSRSLGVLRDVRNFSAFSA